MKKILTPVNCLIGILFGAIAIIGSGAVIIPIFTAILMIRGIGFQLLADRMGNWVWKRTTTFKI